MTDDFDFVSAFLDLDNHNLIDKAVAASQARFEAERAAEREREEQQQAADAEAWRAAVMPTIVGCGVRPLMLENVLHDARKVFEMRDGRVAPRPGVLHPRDPCLELDPVTWLADLRDGPDGELLFGK